MLCCVDNLFDVDTKLRSFTTTPADINKQTAGLPLRDHLVLASSIIFIILIFFLFLNLEIDQFLNGALCITSSNAILSSILFENASVIWLENDVQS